MARPYAYAVGAVLLIIFGTLAAYHFGKIALYKPKRVPLHHFRVEKLDSFPGGKESIALGLNNFGQAVGRAGKSDSTYRAVIWKDGSPVDLGTLGGGYSEARSINDSGVIVGSASAVDGLTHAFIFSKNQMHDLGLLPGGRYSYASDISNQNTTVGLGGTTDLSHAWSWSNSHLIDLGPVPGFTSSAATHIADSGEIIGGASLDTDGGSHAFRYVNRTFSDLGVLPKAIGSIAYGENSQGEIVGSSGSTARHSYPVIWKQGKLFKLQTANKRPYGVAQSINDSGVIVGYFIGDFETHACEWREGQMIDLNDEIPKSSGWDLLKASRINSHGDIVGKGRYNGRELGFLLRRI